MSGSENVCIYRIDSEDRIRDVGGNWERFARAGDAPELVEGALGRRIWDYIHSDEVTHIYQALLGRLRAAGEGASFEFPYRCDSPALRREMRMKLSALEDGGVEFRSVTERETPHESVPLLDAGRQRAGKMIIMCAWCHQVRVGERWVPLEQSLAALGLMNTDTMPPISHGICTDCEPLLRGSGSFQSSRK